MHCASVSQSHDGAVGDRVCRDALTSCDLSNVLKKLISRQYNSRILVARRGGHVAWLQKQPIATPSRTYPSRMPSPSRMRA
eukprot:6150127-Pyramimonas_sp.AAC.1